VMIEAATCNSYTSRKATAAPTSRKAAFISKVDNKKNSFRSSEKQGDSIKRLKQI